MTISQIYEEAKRQLDKGVITIGEFSEIVDREYQEPSKWIPCSERLPEKDVNVLTYHRNESFDYRYVSWIDDYSGKWAGFIGNLPDDVLAWMPLPEPYKGGGEEEEQNDND